jgi:hypothetical protein
MIPVIFALGIALAGSVAAAVKGVWWVAILFAAAVLACAIATVAIYAAERGRSR